MTPKRVISSSDSSSVSVRPSRAKSRSSRKRRVGSASALNTPSSSGTTQGYVTLRSHVNGHGTPDQAARARDVLISAGQCIGGQVPEAVGGKDVVGVPVEVL